MQTLPDVEQAVAHACVFNQAAATGGDARQLVGYLVSHSGLPLDLSALQEKLRQKLPAHMVPVVLLQLASLPLSANGKLDRKALPLAGTDAMRERTCAAVRNGGRCRCGVF
ncbi:enterobactin synthetase component F [Salmonella enterica subsp. arizonae]|uniref:Enterobactin synthetase component F n=1 Tax=Salmonella enterica subsp. arizonae TaxID=59203 RepID=A0A379SHF4_SALER|nr:enterobactin synthetase component F [Salmonella enterica subsp. arizonae]